MKCSFYSFRIVLILLCFALIASAFIPSKRRACANVKSGCKLIETKLGKISGVQLTTVFGGRPFCAYFGIRFGKPPIGELRFKVRWLHSFSSNSVPNSPYFFTKHKTGSRWIRSMERHTECHHICSSLYSNIRQLFVIGAIWRLFISECFCAKRWSLRLQNAWHSGNSLNIRMKLSHRSLSFLSLFEKVIVHIYGGAFTEGSAEKNGPELILNRCAIFVTMNYRVGVFGFLALGLKEYSGNMALKDQQMAMRWVKRYISAFGGDPSHILLFGDSVGRTKHLIFLFGKTLEFRLNSN